MTADELLALPRGYGKRYELVKGELIEMSPAGSKHGKIVSRIHIHLGAYVTQHKLGDLFSSDTGYVLSRDPDTVRGPDTSFVRRERLVDTDGYFPGPPDLAVEVISPNDSYIEVDAKVSEYLAAGTRMVIVVNPRNQTASVSTPKGVLRLSVDDALDGADVVPGWTLPLRELFE